VGPLRVFYEADAEKPDVANVLAIGVKKGNRLLIDDKEIRIRNLSNYPKNSNPSWSLLKLPSKTLLFLPIRKHLWPLLCD
jgi:hypothetical protein